MGGGSIPENFVSSWYNLEVCTYDFRNPAYGATSGHFTQVVWASTQRIGCGIRSCPQGVNFNGRTYRGSVFVCEYDPPGNYLGAINFRNNVLPPSTPLSQCAGKH